MAKKYTNKICMDKYTSLCLLFLIIIIHLLKSMCLLSVACGRHLGCPLSYGMMAQDSQL